MDILPDLFKSRFHSYQSWWDEQLMKKVASRKIQQMLMPLMFVINQNGRMHDVPLSLNRIDKGKKSNEDTDGPSQSNLEIVSLVQPGINIRRNPYTGQLEGVPEEWLHKYKFNFQVDRSKTVRTVHLPEQIRPEYQLPRQIVDFIKRNKQRSNIFQVQAEKAKQKQIKQAKEIFGFNTNHIIRSSILDELSKGSIDINDRTSFIDVITHYGQSIYESKYERQLLTTYEFKRKLENVKLIEDQPAMQYAFLQQLGKGSMCKVYRVVSRTQPRKTFAVRIITIEERRILEKIKEEIAVMQLCQSNNIITYHFSYFYQETLFMFVEFMEFGALNKFINNWYKQLKEGVIAYIIRQILKGLVAIHKRRQLHRDLKSDNILINKNGDIKISDFGFALQFTKEKTTSRELAGTPAWMAPELIKKEQYTESIDIWSLGIILVELCQGEPKYLRMKPLIAMLLIASSPPQTVTGKSQQLRDFLSKCLKKNPEERATARQLLHHPFILSIGSGAEEKQQFLYFLRKSKSFKKI